MTKIFPFILIGSVILIGLGLYGSKTKSEPLTVLPLNPTITPNQAMKDFDKLEIEEIQVGTGSAVKSGDTVVIHYLGTLVNGTKFDSSYDRGQPFETQIGIGRVIAGWDQGVVGMQAGGKRRLKIPSSLAYGSRGAPPTIGPNTPLIFELELLQIK
jgi:FKBP-type peptidyl-prolyl cis-trans isomerase